MEKEVNTEFNIGNEIWCIYKNKAVRRHISGVSISVEEDESVNVKTIITYTLEFDNEIDENKVFRSKNELKEALLR